jgi:hypothetical protein
VERVVDPLYQLPLLVNADALRDIEIGNGHENSPPLFDVLRDLYFIAGPTGTESSLAT